MWLRCVAALGCTAGLASTAAAQAPQAATPIAVVPAGGSATVSGALQVVGGKTIIATAGTITAGNETAEVMLPHRGVLRICASSSVKLTADSSVPAGETPGLMMALDTGAIEASFATGQNSDVLITPDFRILIGGPGAVDLKVRLGGHGDTCVDNPGANAPYVLVTSVFDGGAYRVQAGQRVMFQHGSLHEVVDQEKEPCGCPSQPRPGTNDFPLAQSAGLTTTPPPVIQPPAPAVPSAEQAKAPATINAPLVYQAPPDAPPAAQPAADPAVAQPSPVPAPPHPKKGGFFHRVGGFFRRLFGAE